MIAAQSDVSVEICQAVYYARFNFSNERELQAGVAEVLKQQGIDALAEYSLTDSDRIDFWVPGGIGVEVKIDLSPAEVTRQLWRYAQSAEINALILVTTRSRHSRKIPPTILGKPVYVVYLLHSAI